MEQVKKTTLEGETYNGTQVVRAGESTVPAFEKTCRKCGTKFLYISDAIKQDKDGDYVICPSCGAFISHQETLKTINFIPPKCVSDAKCEDRPSKSGDSITTLEEAAEKYYQKEVEETKCHYASALTYAQGHEDALLRVKSAFIAGIKWQKEQMEKNRLVHCDSLTKEEYDIETAFADEIIEKENRTPTFIDAIKYGMKLQKEQMMKDAVEGEVMMNAFHPHEPRITASYPNCPYKFGVKVKIIIVKEDKK
jgi:DNA-directed RNA polymerase subunit RPC12/RpoP